MGLPKDLESLARIFYPENKWQVFIHSKNENQKIARIQQQGPESGVVFCQKEELATELWKLPQIHTLILFGRRSSLDGFRELFYIKNPDRSIRWLFPRKGQYLVGELYNGNGWKAKWFKKAMTGKWGKFFPKGRLLIAQRSWPILPEKPKEFALFTGTPGLDRKVVMACGKKGRCLQYAKAPITEISSVLVQREYQNLEFLSQYPFRKMVVPLAGWRKGMLVQSNITPGFGRVEIAEPGPLHFDITKELIRFTAEKRAPEDLMVWQDMQQNLQYIREWGERAKVQVSQLDQIKSKLDLLLARYTGLAELPVQFTHGDFTPWNQFSDQRKLYVYDWEMGGKRPFFYDLFHFILQSGILIHRKPAEVIWEELLQLADSDRVNHRLTKSELNGRDLLALYLLIHLSYYLRRYLQQEKWHIQVSWQLKTWAVLLEKWAETEAAKCSPTQLIEPI